MKIFKIILLNCIVIPCSCYAQIDVEKAKAEYKEVLSLYPEKLTDNFPNSKDKVVLYLHLGYPGQSALNSIYAAFLYEEEQVLELNEKIKSKELSCYYFTDSCLMMTDYDDTLFPSELYHFKQCDSMKYPIPNFEFLIESSLPLDFYKQSRIYVIGAEKGEF